MSNTKKLTKREKFEMLANITEVKANPMLVEFIEHELELLAKKNASGEGKMTTTQKENKELKDQILECMKKEPDKLFTISDMLKDFPFCRELNLTNQRVSALVRQLKEDRKVERIVDKRKAYFKLA